MRILVVGAGAIGGYFGGRLLEAGRDVTFLVRPSRKAQLARDRPGHPIAARRCGNFRPDRDGGCAACLIRSDPVELQSIRPARRDGILRAGGAGTATAILPLLNGISHLDSLEQRFGASAVLGGLCVISTTLDEDGRVLHLNDTTAVLRGTRWNRTGAGSRNRIRAVRREIRCAAESRNPAGMWEKWVFIATAAGITCLMRATIGDIVAAGASDLAGALLDECAEAAQRNGYPPREAAVATQPGDVHTPPVRA